ncbi:MAG TPA: glycosyltransferase family 39 protein [Patescibacteria group bacterium]|nr:glycosyltransferase family 39 protein [Patescibacteria group bacterium]
MTGRRRLVISGMGLAVVVCLGFLLRVHALIAVPEEGNFGLGTFVDSFLYNTLACNMYAGKGFAVDQYDRLKGTVAYTPAFSRGPAYPFFMAAVFALFHNPSDSLSVYTWHRMWDKVRLAQCFLDTACCVLVFFIVRVIYPGSLIMPLISAGLYSICPYSIYFTRVLLSEILTTFLLSAFVLFAVAGMRKRDSRWFFGSGVLFGLVLLSRPEYVLFVFVFVGFLLCSARSDIKVALRWAATYALGVALLVLPWSARNYLIFKRPVLISTGGIGESLYFGTCIDAAHWRGWNRIPEMIEYIDEADRQGFVALRRVHLKMLESGTIDEMASVDRRYAHLALRRLLRRPQETLKLWILKVPRLWYQNRIPMYRDPEPSGVLMLVYCATALCAYVFGRKGRRAYLMAPVALLCAYLTVVFLPLHVEPRYSVPVLPALISLSGIGIVGLARFFARLRLRRSRS